VELSFAELVERIRSGDSESLRQLLTTYGDALKREVRFTLLDARLKQIVGESDIYQSVVVRFFLGMKDGNFDVQSPEDLQRLLKGIARVRIAELVRYWHTQKRDLNRTRQLGADIAERGLLPLDVLERTELVANVDGRLSQRDRDILQWRDEGRSWPQIADLLGERSSEAVRKRHERAMAEIQRELTDRDSPEKPYSEFC